MIKINVILSNNDWGKYLKNPDLFIDRKLKIINKNIKILKNKVLIVSLLLSDYKEIKKLNKIFRKQNKSTDVLSFPFYKRKDFNKELKKNKEIYLGDIIINLKKVKNKKNAASFKNEFNKLWIHGLAHLLGYDHKKEKDFKRMIKVEKEFLRYVN